MTLASAQSRKIVNVVASICVPFLIQALQLWLTIQLDAGPGYFTYAVSIGAGLLLLVLQFRLYAILLALVYVPIMFLSLLYFTLAVGVRFYGEGP